MKKNLIGVLAGSAIIIVTAGCPPAHAETPAQAVWMFDRLDAIGGIPTHVEGHPHLISTPAGKAVAFNGVDDALFIDQHPLAGATTFTVEAVFRPEGGAFEQRWLHLSETDPKTGADTGPRFLFEIRVVNGSWYLDSFTDGSGYHMPLMVPEKTHPIGPWYRAEMTYDGKIFRSYVDGELQTEAALDFKPQGPGHSSIGTRINRVDYFKGAVFEARFTRQALTPGEFLPLPAGLNAGGK